MDGHQIMCTLKRLRSTVVLVRTLSLFTLLFGASAAVSENNDQQNLRRLFVLANLEFTLFHEISHLLIDELKLPVLGMEEDAADRIAIIAMLKGRQGKSEQEIIPWLFSVAGDWYAEWELRHSLKRTTAYWDGQRLEIQRFHNIVCLIYGSNPDLLEDLIATPLLPFERAMSCEYEFQMAHQAVEWILANYGHSDADKTADVKVSVVYKKPYNSTNQTMLEWVKESGLADRQALLLASRFGLPRETLIEFDNCGSSPDAYWHKPTGTIYVCYELLSHFLKMAEHRLAKPKWACNVASLRQYMDDVGAPCPKTGAIPQSVLETGRASQSRSDGKEKNKNDP